MTKEAMATNLRKLKPGGIVALHVSSRYMELVSVVAGIAQATTLVSSGNWALVRPDPRQWVWTDDYSNVIGAMIRHLGP